MKGGDNYFSFSVMHVCLNDIVLTESFFESFLSQGNLIPTLGAGGFFLVGGDRIERRSREGESRSGEKKTSGTNG